MIWWSCSNQGMDYIVHLSIKPSDPVFIYVLNSTLTYIETYLPPSGFDVITWKLIYEMTFDV